MAQSVEHPALGFSSGHDLTVREFEPRIRLCAVSVEPAWDSLPALSAPTPLVHSLFSQNKQTLKKVIMEEEDKNAGAS